MAVFGEALEKLRSGFRIKRAKWNQGYYIECVIRKEKNVMRICYHPKGGFPNCQKWNPMHDDLFADDWESFDPLEDIWKCKQKG